MAWGMTDNEKSIPEIWKAFALATIKLDKDNNKPNGWHWLWGIRGLGDMGIVPKVPNTWINLQHSSNRTNAPTSEVPDKLMDSHSFYCIVHDLIKDLCVSKEITRIDFSGLEFKKNDVFLNFIFPVDTSFERTTFSNIADFSDTIFKSVDFSNAVFSDYANFRNAQFLDRASFYKVTFFDCADFNYAKFYKRAVFTNTNFHQKKLLITFFTNVHFSGKVLFNDAKFYCDTHFTGIKLPKNIFFTNAVFSKNVYFMKTNFFETADFKNAEFHGETAKFKGTIFSKIADFSNTTFKHYANFTDSKFYGRTSFQRAKFETHAPRFYEATLNKQIAWDKITWPKFPMIFCILLDKFLRLMWYKFDSTDNTDDIRENQNSYENLAYLMEGLGKYHDSHLFFRQEMRCRRKLEHPLMKPFYWFYQLFADYGYGIGRAFSWWLGHIFIGAIAIAIITCYTGLSSQQTIFCSISTSFANANPFVFIGFKDGGLTDCYKVLHYLLPIKFGAIRGIQTFIGIPLLFLLLTTLRVRFRLGSTTNNTTIKNTIETPSKK